MTNNFIHWEFFEISHWRLGAFGPCDDSSYGECPCCDHMENVQVEFNDGLVA